MYGQHSAESTEAPDEPVDNTNIGAYFDYMGLPPWQNHQPQQPHPQPHSNQASSHPTHEGSVQSDMLLDPMDQLERDLLGFENTEFPELMTPVSTSMPELPTAAPLNQQINQPQMPMMINHQVQPVVDVNQMRRTPEIAYNQRVMMNGYDGMMQQQHQHQQPINHRLSRSMNTPINSQINIQRMQLSRQQQAQQAARQQVHQQARQQVHHQMQQPLPQVQQPHSQIQQQLSQTLQPRSQLEIQPQPQPQQQQQQQQQQQAQLQPLHRAQPQQAHSIPSSQNVTRNSSPLLAPQARTPLGTHPSTTSLTQLAQTAPRVRYKARSSIPPDLSSANYAAQCIAAAESSRLPPYSLSFGEYNHLRNVLPHVHVTTYLGIRNGILRLWLANPLVSVTIVEAAGCCKEARYYPMAEFAFEWLVRNGYINQGCYTHVNRTSASTIASLPQFNHRKRKPRQTIVVIGAGIAGLSCARQLENLLERYSPQILTEFEEIPRVVVLEARKRVGGRIYSPMLSTEHTSVDLGGDTIMGFGGGNPLGVVMRRQLGIPVVSVDTTSDNNVLYSSRTGDPIGAQTDYRAHEIFKHLLDKMKNFEMGQSHSCISGVKSLLRAGQDPRITDPEQEKVTIGQFEEEEEKPYTKLSSDDSDDAEQAQQEIKLERDFLESLGLDVNKMACESKEQDAGRLHAEQTEHGPSLGLTMNKVAEQLLNLTNLGEDDLAAINWYFAKFEYLIGDNIDRASLSSWSHHRQNRFTGRYAWARDGMGTLIKGLDTVPGKLDVRFKTVVNVVEWEDDSSEITLENGEQVQVDRCVITVPLGCLKRRTLQFIPDLPKWKSDSIDRLEFGVVNKVVLLFEEPFWDHTEPSLIRIANDVGDDGQAAEKRGDCFVFQNHTKRCDVGTKSLIVGLVSGAAANSFAEESDYEIIERAVSKLRHVFRRHPKAESSRLVESIVTRWQIDRFSKGTFSHVGVEGTSTDHDLLARPVQHSLFFAGEATCRPFPGTMHGAYISGLRAAKEVINSLVGGIEMPENMVDDELANSIRSMNGESPEDEAGNTVNVAVAAANVVNGGGASSVTASVPPEDISDAAAVAATVFNDRSNSVSSLGSIGGAANVGNAMQPPSRTISPMGVQGAPSKRHIQATEEVYNPIVDYEKAERELSDLRRHRMELEQEQLERDMMHEIGQRPVKPERHGITNPFLLFQKDYWEICRQETEASKLREKKGGNGNSEFHASRNEIRAGLGKKWRSLPEDQRAPYIERSRQAKVENEERQETYYRKLKWYESEAANFQQQWAQEHPSQPTPREKQLEEQLDLLKPKKKKSRLTE